MLLQVSQKVDGSKRVLSVTQEKFCADGSDGDSSSRWLVPLSVSSKSSPTTALTRSVLDDVSTSITIDGVPSDDWIKLNMAAVGFYRTQYSPDMLDALIPAVNNGSLPPRDRLALQNDLFALVSDFPQDPSWSCMPCYKLHHRHACPATTSIIVMHALLQHPSSSCRPCYDIRNHHLCHTSANIYFKPPSKSAIAHSGVENFV